jgi:hypothetical protein
MEIKPNKKITPTAKSVIFFAEAKKLPLFAAAYFGVICLMEYIMEESRLCKTLQPILDSELAEGNSIESIDTPAGTNCPFAVHLKNKINHLTIKKLSLANTVENWQNKDKHYPLQNGYSCTKFKHSIAGPL